MYNVAIQTAVATAPAAMDELKKRFPRAWRKMQGLWSKSSVVAGSAGDIAKDVKAAVVRGDNDVVAAAYRTAFRAGVTNEQFAAILDREAASEVATLGASVKQRVQRDVDVVNSDPKAQGLDRITIATKKMELLAVQRITGWSLEEVRQILVFIETTSVAQLNEIETQVKTSQGIRIN